MSKKAELSLAPVEGEVMPVGKMQILTVETVNVLAVIKSVSNVEVLANTEETAKGVIELKASYLSVVEKAKAEFALVRTKAEFERAKECRLSIRTKRLNFTKEINNELAARKLIYDSAKKGKEKVEEAFEALEKELDAVEKPVDERLKSAAAKKKAVADAISKLKAHAINPLLSAAEIETAIDDFRLSFCDTDYQESQSVAETIFEAKVTEFEAILSAAVVREENEERVRIGRTKDKQLANINVTFPIVEISCYAARSSVDIQSRIDLTTKVDMTAFELVLAEADAQKQACLNMLAAFLPMAVAREAKEAADKAESERLEREKQAEINAKAAREVTDNETEVAFVGVLENHCNQDGVIKPLSNEVIERINALKDKAESAIIELINDDAGVAEDVAKIIGEPCFKQVNEKSIFISRDVAECLSEGYNHDDGYEVMTLIEGENGRWDRTDSVFFTKNGQWYRLDYTLGLTEMQCPDKFRLVNGMVEAFKTNPIEPAVTIPVKHLINLIFAAEQGFEHCGLDDDVDTANAIEFAKSLI